MAVNVPLIRISDLAEQTTAADTDYIVIGNTDINKIKWPMIIKSIQEKLAGSETNKVLITDTNGKVLASVITSEELLMLEGVKSNIQNQIDGLMPKSGGTFTGAVSFKSGIELYYSTPFIDFHYGNGTSDYSSRIIANGDQTLDIGGGTYGFIRFDAKSGNLRPVTAENFSLGSTNYRFYKLWVSNGVDNSSLAELKTDIKPFKNALKAIEETDVYNYKLKEAIKKNNDDIIRTGFVIGDGYKCSPLLIGESGQGIDLYSAIGVTFEAVKEMNEKIKEQSSRINELENMIKTLRHDINEIKSLNTLNNEEREEYIL